MKKLKTSGVYAIKNRANNKMYIGSSGNMYRRRNDHFNKLRNNKHCNTHLQRAWNKYGEDNFEFIILQRHVENDKLFIYERNFIIGFDTLEKGYNQSLPNDNGGPKHSEETIEKLSKHQKEIWNSLSEEEINRRKEKQSKRAIENNSRPVKHIPTNTTYTSIKEAAKAEGVSVTAMAKRLDKGDEYIRLYEKQSKSKHTNRKKNKTLPGNSKITKDQAIEIINRFENENISPYKLSEEIDVPLHVLKDIKYRKAYYFLLEENR